LHGRFLLVFTGFPRTTEHEQEPFVLFCVLQGRLLEKVVQKYNNLCTYTTVRAKRTKKNHDYIAKKL